MCCLPNNFDDLQYLIQSANIYFNAIPISESRTNKNKWSVVNVNVPNYSCQFYPADWLAGGTQLYIKNHLSYKPRRDLNLYKLWELEWTFIGISNSKKTIIVSGSIYKHPDTSLNQFNEFYLNDILDKLSKENKTVVLLENININGLDYD